MARAGSERNALLALVGLVIASGFTAGASAWISGYVLDSLHNSNAMALLLTDAGVKADDANLERQLSTATAALRTVKDLATALAVGALGVGGAALYRLARSEALATPPRG